MRKLESFLPIDSFTRVRPPVPPERARPAVGLLWGEASDFTFAEPENTDQSVPDYQRGGIGDDLGAVEEADQHRRAAYKINGWGTPFRSEETKETTIVYPITPVWRKYDVWRIPDANNPDQYIDVKVTTELLIPLGMQQQKYVGFGLYSDEAPKRRSYTETRLHSYIHMKLPRPDLNGTKVEYGLTEGEYPPYPQEEYSPDSFTAEMYARFVKATE